MGKIMRCREEGLGLGQHRRAGVVSWARRQQAENTVSFKNDRYSEWPLWAGAGFPASPCRVFVKTGCCAQSCFHTKAWSNFLWEKKWVCTKRSWGIRLDHGKMEICKALLGPLISRSALNLRDKHYSSLFLKFLYKSRRVKLCFWLG